MLLFVPFLNRTSQPLFITCSKVGVNKPLFVSSQTWLCGLNGLSRFELPKSLSRCYIGYQYETPAPPKELIGTSYISLLLLVRFVGFTVVHSYSATTVCSPYGLEVTLENQLSALQRVRDAGLEPITLVNGDPTIAVAASTKKIDMEPWRYLRLPQDSKREQTCDDSNSSESFVGSIPPSRSAVLNLVAKIMPSTPIPDVTEECFLAEDEVYDIVSAYIPDGAVTPDGLSAWMSKDGTWVMTIRKQADKKRKRGRLLNVVKKACRDFTWDGLSNIQQYRLLVKSTMATKCTAGYVRKSNTIEPDIAKKKLVNLQIYKMQKKLLCEEVFVSYNTSANDPISERDATAPQFTFDDCSGNTQDLINKITKSTRQIRLVVIDYAGPSTNTDDISLFISSSKSMQEIVVDIGHKVEVYSQHNLVKSVEQSRATQVSYKS